MNKGSAILVCHLIVETDVWYSQLIDDCIVKVYRMTPESTWRLLKVENSFLLDFSLLTFH